jgi:hypothetical protein
MPRLPKRSVSKKRDMPTIRETTTFPRPRGARGQLRVSARPPFAEPRDKLINKLVSKTSPCHNVKSNAYTEPRECTTYGTSSRSHSFVVHLQQLKVDMTLQDDRPTQQVSQPSRKISSIVKTRCQNSSKKSTTDAPSGRTRATAIRSRHMEKVSATSLRD